MDTEEILSSSLENFNFERNAGSMILLPLNK